MHRGSDPELADGRGSRRWNRPAYGARRPERLCRQSYRVVCRDGFIDWVLCLRWNGRRRCETHGRGRKLFGAARRAACSSCNRCAWGDLRSGPGLPTMGHARHLSLHRHRVSYGSFDQPGGSLARYRTRRPRLCCDMALRLPSGRPSVCGGADSDAAPSRCVSVMKQERRKKYRANI